MSRPKRPDVELEIEVTDDDVAFFRENGYFVVDRITTDEELDWITEIYDELYALPVPVCLTRPMTPPGPMAPSTSPRSASCCSRRPALPS